MMKKTLMMTAMTALLVAITSPAFGVATFTFNENMEQYGLNTVIATGTPTTVTGSSWYFEDFGGDAPNPPTATVVADPTGSGRGQVLNYLNPIPTSGTGYVTSMNAFSSLPLQTLFTSFDIYMTGSNNTTTLLHGITDSLRVHGPQSLMGGFAGPVGAFNTLEPADTSYQFLAAMDFDEWYRIEEFAYGPSSVDGTPNTWDVKIIRASDGTVVTDTTGLLWRANRPDAKTVKFGTIGRSNFNVLLDNIVIADHYVPEPSTFALLGISGLFLLRRRRTQQCA